MNLKTFRLYIYFLLTIFSYPAFAGDGLVNSIKNILHDIPGNISVSATLGKTEVDNPMFADASSSSVRINYGINDSFSLSLGLRKINNITANITTPISLSYEEQYNIGAIYHFSPLGYTSPYLRYDLTQWELESRSLGTVLGQTDGRSNGAALGIKIKLINQTNLVFEYSRLFAVDDGDISTLSIGAHHRF